MYACMHACICDTTAACRFVLHTITAKRHASKFPAQVVRPPIDVYEVLRSTAAVVSCLCVVNAVINTISYSSTAIYTQVRRILLYEVCCVAGTAAASLCVIGENTSQRELHRRMNTNAGGTGDLGTCYLVRV